MSGWYTVFCKPRGEQTAETNLSRQGYTVYLPRLLVHRRRAGRRVECVEPLFPRYLFLKVRDAAQSLAPVRSTLGVANIVRFGIHPAMLPDEVVAALRVHEDTARGVHVQRIHFEEGDSVKLMDGPLPGLTAVFAKEDGGERAIVLLDMLGKTNSFSVDRTWLAPAA